MDARDQLCASIDLERINGQVATLLITVLAQGTHPYEKTERLAGGEGIEWGRYGWEPLDLRRLGSYCEVET